MGYEEWELERAPEREARIEKLEALVLSGTAALLEAARQNALLLKVALAALVQVGPHPQDCACNLCEAITAAEAGGAL